MRKSIIGLVLVLGLAPSAASAKPFVRVHVATPTVVVAPPVVVHRAPVVVRPACPGPDYVWVEPHWKVDRFGRRVHVAGHWSHRPHRVVVTAPVHHHHHHH